MTHEPSAGCTTVVPAPAQPAPACHVIRYVLVAASQNWALSDMPSYGVHPDGDMYTGYVFDSVGAPPQPAPDHVFWVSMTIGPVGTGSAASGAPEPEPASPTESSEPSGSGGGSVAPEEASPDAPGVYQDGGVHVIFREVVDDMAVHVPSATKSSADEGAPLQSAVG